MSKKKKIVLGILTVFLLLIVLAVILNFDLLMVVKDGVFETPESLTVKKEETTNKEQEALEKAGVENVRPLTEEEKEELKSGNITEEDALNIITGKTTIEKVKEKKNGGGTQEGNTQGSAGVTAEQTPVIDNSVNVKIADLIGKIYVLEARFTSELKSLEVWAINEYESVTKAEKPAKKKELASIGFPKLTALEKECDQGVEAILTELTTILKDSGQSTELVNQIRDAYTEKKQITKSYYISEYM